MNVEYNARNEIELTEALREFTEKKLRKVVKYFNHILEVKVEFGQERHLFTADIFIKGKDFDVKSTARAKELTAAVQEAVDKLENQAAKAKTKLKERKRGADGGAGWQVDVLEPSSITTGAPRIVKSSTIPIKPMTVEEAALQLEGSRSDFIVFRNAATDRINVLYRRKDKNLGLITPEF